MVLNQIGADAVHAPKGYNLNADFDYPTILERRPTSRQAQYPHYLEVCYAAVDGTLLEETKLKIEIIPGNTLCKHCHYVFNLLQNKDHCSECQGAAYEILSGREFMIQAIVAC